VAARASRSASLSTEYFVCWSCRIGAGLDDMGPGVDKHKSYDAGDLGHLGLAHADRGDGGVPMRNPLVISGPWGVIGAASSNWT